jgi:GNAT-family acetyltransferase (TIGR03103 family)
MNPEADADAVNRLYALHRMVRVPPILRRQHEGDARLLTYFVAEDQETGQVIGTVTGYRSFGRVRRSGAGSSLWTLAVDPQTPHSRVGEALIRWLAEHYQTRVRYMDLSVMHDNEGRSRLYEKLRFRRLPVFAVKRRNVINERLFVGSDPAESMNPYARIIIDEARRRGIGVEVLDAAGGVFELRLGGRKIRCRESLSDLTTAVSLSMCDDKAMTRRLVSAAGVSVPDEVEASDMEAVRQMLGKYGSARREARAGRAGPGSGRRPPLDGGGGRGDRRRVRKVERVLVESYHPGEDLRLIVIGFKLVAAAVRRPASIVGDGRHAVRELIERQSRRREAATGGESTIPLDSETERCVRNAGYELNRRSRRRRQLPCSQGGEPAYGRDDPRCDGPGAPGACRCCNPGGAGIDIPVVGVDLIVEDPAGPNYVFIEANERPGLANHEPQPTAERFIDLLFPLSMPEKRGRRRRSDAARD